MEHLGDVAQLIIALATAFNAWQSWHGRRQSNINASKIDEVHLAINSRMDQLVTASEAKGAVDERGRAEGLADDREGNGLLDRLKR